MLLREFIYFDKDSTNLQSDGRYDPSSDSSILSLNDTRKTRLTLKMINKLRLAGESREVEKEEDLVLIRSMYAKPPTPIGP